MLASEVLMQTDSSCGMCGRSFADDPKPTTLFELPVHRACSRGFYWRRTRAAVVDIVIAFALLLGISFGPMFATDAPYGGDGTSHAHSAFLAAIAFLLSKDACFGISPGKALFGLQVVDADTDAPIGARQSLQRNLILLSCLSIIVPVGLVRLLSFSLWKIAYQMRFGPRLGEGWANTRVIDRKLRGAPVFTAPDLDRIRRSSLAA